MERLLISENEDGVRSVNAIAQANCSKLNSLREYADIRDRETLQSLLADKKNFILNKFFTENPDAKRLWELSRIEFVLPAHLEGLKLLIESININSVFEFVKYDPKKQQWTINKTAIDEFCDKRYRKYATGPEQIARWKFAESYVSFLKGNLNAGPIALRNFTGPIMKYDPHKGYVPDENFISLSVKF